MSDSFITLNRKILSWRWYKNSSVSRVFIHCLLRANWKDNDVEDMKIMRGQFVTSYGKIAEQTGLGVKQVRNALKKLENTSEILTNTTNKYTIVTVNKYDDYQNISKEGANKGQTKGNQRATNNKENNEEQYNTIIEIDDLFKRYLEDERLNNAFRNNFRVTKEYHHKYLSDFTEEQKGKGKFLYSYVDYASHFYHWFKIQRKKKLSQKPNSEKAL